MFTVRLGPRPAVVLCGYSALRDALVLQADAFSGRGAMAVFQHFTRGNGESQAAEELAGPPTLGDKGRGQEMGRGRTRRPVKAKSEKVGRS